MIGNKIKAYAGRGTLITGAVAYIAELEDRLRVYESIEEKNNG